MIADRLAEVLDLVELVAREQDAAPRPGLLDQHLADGVDPARVEPGQRLVQDEQLRFVDEGGGELHPLLVAVGERLDLVPGAVGDPEPLEPCSPAAAGVGRRSCRAAAPGTRAARRPACPGTGRAPRACSRSGAARPGRPASRSSAPSRRRGRSDRTRRAWWSSCPRRSGRGSPPPDRSGTEKDRSSRAVSDPKRRRSPSSSSRPPTQGP